MSIFFDSSEMRFSSSVRHKRMVSGFVAKWKDELFHDEILISTRLERVWLNHQFLQLFFCATSHDAQFAIHFSFIQESQSVVDFLSLNAKYQISLQ